MIHQAIPTTDLTLKIMKALWSWFILVSNHQQCSSVTPKLRCSFDTKGYKSNTLVITSVWLTLKDFSNIITIWDNIYLFLWSMRPCPRSGFTSASNVSTCYTCSPDIKLLLVEIEYSWSARGLYTRWLLWYHTETMESTLELQLIDN